MPRLTISLPTIFPAGLALLILPSAALRVAAQSGSDGAMLALLGRLELASLGLVLPFCNLNVLIALGACTVMVMKGPAYVADAYYLQETKDDE